jgi:hypothetical protein
MKNINLKWKIGKRSNEQSDPPRRLFRGSPKERLTDHHKRGKGGGTETPKRRLLLQS